MRGIVCRSIYCVVKNRIESNRTEIDISEQILKQKKNQKLERTLRSRTPRLATSFPSLSLLFARNFVYRSSPNNVLSLIEYMAAHFGSLLSSATKRAAVLNSGREEVRRGMCSLSYQSTRVERKQKEETEERDELLNSICRQRWEDAKMLTVKLLFGNLPAELGKDQQESRSGLKFGHDRVFSSQSGVCDCCETVSLAF